MEPLKDLEPKNIIVRMPNWIGDLVMATPVLADLRKAYPKAKITAMCRYPLSDLLREDPQIDEIFCFSRTRTLGRLTSYKKRGVEKLRDGKYDLGVLLTHSFSSALWFWQGKISNRIGYDCNGRRLFLTHSIPMPENLQKQHLVKTYKMLLGPLGISLSNGSPALYITDKEKEMAREFLYKLGVPKEATIVGINPGATYGSAKCWLPERFREVTELLLKEDVFILYFGDQVTSGVVKEICKELPERVINLAGETTLRELSSLISLCHVLLTNDSGPMHIADAVGTPLIALFGSTNEVITGPYRSGKVIHKHVNCSPCYQRTCPIDFRCMKRIESEEVFHEILSVLNSRSINKLHITM